MFAFITRLLTHPGLTRSNSGSPRFSERSLPAASSLRLKILIVNLCATSVPTIAQLHPSNGPIKMLPTALNLALKINDTLH